MARHYDLLIVGGGMAAGRLLENLHSLDFKRSVAVVSNEAHTGYNRVLLPGYLSGECGLPDLHGHHDWQQRDNIDVLASSQVCALDLARRVASVETAGTPGFKNLSFANLVIATGSTVPSPQLAARTHTNIFQLRSLADADRVREQVAASMQGTAGNHALVVGGGLLGLEAADALNAAGMQVRVVHRGAQLMNRQLDQEAGDELAAALGDDGIALSLGAEVVQLLGEQRVSAVQLSDGTRVAADLVLFATGARPNTRLAEGAGVHCDGGVCTDRYLRTNQPGVFALGECAVVAGERHSLVEAVHAQADALAQTLNGNLQGVESITPGTRLKVSRLAVFAAGETRPQAGEHLNDVVIRDRAQGIYRRLMFSGSQLVGAVLMGNTSAAREISQRIGSAVEHIERDRLAFGIS